ncbi:MAG: DAK2 domain-containing protein [Eubacteriales bacterium]|nr:DAK2 domain-containing protein [Eubacteriales bacterium]
MRTIDSSDVALMLESASNNLQNNKKAINDLNVFPVPDGDTGTNMGLTFGAAVQVALSDKNASAGDMMGFLSKASLRNARGNSGVILSQILRGVSKALAGKTEFGVDDIKNAAAAGRDTAYRAVMKPTEGTILTVVREGAEFAEENADKFDDASEFFSAYIHACRESLERTPEILPVLKQAGVVDAGGCGVVTILEGAEYALKNGKPIESADSVEVKSSAAASGSTDIDTANIRFQYCTEFIIQKSSADRQASQFKAAISPKGDCMLVIDDEDIVKVHIHTNHPGFVMEEALKLGQLINIKVDNMKYQHSENIRSAEEEKAESDSETAQEPVELKKYGVVAVSAGDGLTEVFKSVNVDKVVQGGQTMNPSTQDLLDAANSVHAEIIYILPNNKNIILAAEQVNDICDKKVIVIPTKNIPQGISAMLAFDPDADEGANTEAMTEMMNSVKCGQVTFAARDSAVGGLEIHKDDVMGMFGSEIAELGSDINDVSEKLAEKMIDEETALITIYYGADTDEQSAQKLADAISEKHSDIDVSVVKGGQPVYYYMIAAE